jgi:hypothetical protein
VSGGATAETKAPGSTKRIAFRRASIPLNPEGSDVSKIGGTDPGSVPPWRGTGTGGCTPSEDWQSVSQRLGWLTWEDCNEVLPGSCRWLSRN